MEPHLKIIGLLLIALALMHAGFPRYFNWGRELAGLTMINREMMKTHTFFIALVVLMIGLLCVTSAGELIHTDVGRRVSLGLFVFWGLRLLAQLFFYSPQLWKGKLFETVVHVVFTLFWSYMTVVFFLVWRGVPT